MSVKIKSGTTFVLPVEIQDRNFDQISAIEFLFKQTMNGKTLKTAYWSKDGASRGCVKRAGQNVILVSFSRSDSYLFKQNAIFYMDTRIHYTGTETNPYTKIISLQMRDTLFAEDEEVIADGE